MKTPELPPPQWHEMLMDLVGQLTGAVAAIRGMNVDTMKPFVNRCVDAMTAIQGDRSIDALTWDDVRRMLAGCLVVCLEELEETP